MFDLFSWSHIVILLVVALVVVGPKDLPRLMHMAGKWAGKARAMANEFRKSFDEMARQAELDELRKEIEDLKMNNPVTDLANSMADATAAINNPVTNATIDAMTDGAAESSQNMAPAETTAPVEGAIEPRSGEFEVTDTAAVAPPHGPAAP
jgi:sec-independent protein translocase protein TatB